MLAHGEIIRERDLHIVLVHEQDHWWHAAVKTDQSRQEAYLVSLRRTHLGNVQALRRRGKKHEGK